MGFFSKRRRPRKPNVRWAWWLFFVLFGSTVGWFWLLGQELRLERKKEPPVQTTAKLGR